MTLDWRRLSLWGVAVALMAFLVSLGMWQLNRADQKQHAQSLLMAREALPALQNQDWPCFATSAASSNMDLPWHRPAALKGIWWHDKTVWLENRPHRGQTGFVAVTPLKLEAPGHACHQQIVLVQRGWAPRHSLQRTQVPRLQRSEGEISIVGHLMPHLPRVYQMGQEVMPDPSGALPVIRQNADADFWRQWLGRAPLMGVLRQSEPSSAHAANDPLRRDWEPLDSGRDKHLAYAAQWFALAFVVLLLTLWFQLIRPYFLDRHPSHAAV